MRQRPNLNQTSAYRLKLNFKILTKPTGSFLTCSAQKVLSVKLHSKSHKKESEFTYWLALFGQNLLKKTPCSFKISTMIQLHTSTKHKWQNTDQTPVPNSCLNFNFKILTKPCAQKQNCCNQTSASKSAPNCRQHVFSAPPSATVTTSTSFGLASSRARVTSIKSTKRHKVS